MLVTLNTYFHIISFNIAGSNISYGISPNITDIKLTKLCKDGYMEFETNKGLEGIDLFDEDDKLISKGQKEKILNKLKTLKVEDVKVCIE